MHTLPVFMPYDYRAVYRRGMDVLEKVKWSDDPEGMFRPPSAAKGQPLRLECERLANQLAMPVTNVCEEMMTTARIHHFIAICGTPAREYFLGGDCPLDPIKIGKLSRRMPPFIRAKMKTLLAGSVNVVSNPDHAFDTDGWPELKRRLPKFRATLEHYAAHCTGTPMQARLVESEIDRLSAKLRLIQQECVLIEQKLRSTQSKGTDVFHPRAQTSTAKPAPDWSKAHARISLVYGVLQKTYRDISSKFWKPEWTPTEVELGGVITDVHAMFQAAANIDAWLHR